MEQGGDSASMLCFSSHINTYTKVGPSHLVVRDGIRNNRTRSSENTLGKVKFHCRLSRRMHSTGASPRGQNLMFFTHFTATVRHSFGGPARLALGSFLTYMLARAGVP